MNFGYIFEKNKRFTNKVKIDYKLKALVMSKSWKRKRHESNAERWNKI